MKSNASGRTTNAYRIEKVEKISVCIPLLNEEGSLEELANLLTAALNNLGLVWEIIFVNDGSTDGSTEILNQFAATDNRIKVVHLRRNSGQTAAMMAGIDFSSGDVIILMDADLQNDPSDIKPLIKKIEEGYDVVSGWRKERKDGAVNRNFPSRIANWIISKVSGVHLHDFGCTLKAYRKEVIKDVRLYGEMHRFIPIYTSWRGAKITEVVVTHHARKYGKSNYGLERIGKVILDLIVVKFLDRFAEKPIYIFGGFGLLNLVCGFGAGCVAVYQKIFNDVSFIKTPLPLLTVYLMSLGIISILLGLLAELITRTWYESQNKTTYIINEIKNL